MKLKKSQVVALLENAIKQQSLCNGLYKLLSSGVDDFNANFDPFVELIIGISPEGMSAEYHDAVYDVFYGIVASEGKDYREKAVRVYKELVNFEFKKQRSA